MTPDIPLDSMSVTEKLLAIETIWESLCQSNEPVPVPGWHQDVLRERLDRIQSGKAKLLDWEDVKSRLNELGK